jgi:hypothetical protein
MERKRVKGRFVAEDKGGVVKKQIAAPTEDPQPPAAKPRSLVGLLLHKWKRSRSGGKDFAATHAAD